jgi:hypothetical protein
MEDVPIVGGAWVAVAWGGPPAGERVVPLLATPGKEHEEQHG